MKSPRSFYVFGALVVAGSILTAALSAAPRPTRSGDAVVRAFGGGSGR